MSQQGELINDFHSALAKGEWAVYYKYITDNGYLCSNVGDYFTTIVGEKLIISQRRMTSEKSNDFQVIEIYKLVGDSKYVIYDLQEIVDEILESGEKYDSRTIEERLYTTLQTYDTQTILTKFNRNSLKFDIDYSNANKNGTNNEVSRTSSGRLDRTGISDSNKQGVHTDKRENIKTSLKSRSNREILADALETTIDTSTQTGQNEFKTLKTYKENIEKLEELQKHLSEVKAEIKYISFSKGKRDMARLRNLNDDKIKTQNRISIYDKKLLNLEATKPIKDLLAREKEKTLSKRKRHHDYRI